MLERGNAYRTTSREGCVKTRCLLGNVGSQSIDGWKPLAVKSEPVHIGM